MKARVLSANEWGLLEPTQLPVLLPFLNPATTQIVVVEDAGRVVASLAVLRVSQLEGAWIHPEYRNAGVVRGLLREAARVGASYGDTWFLAGAASDEMRSILGRLGAAKLAMDNYAVAFDVRES